MSDTQASPPLEGMPALEEAFFHYRKQGLRVPPVPHTLVPALVRRSAGVFTSTPMSLEDRAGALALAVDPKAPEQVGFGHIGHGIASWFYCCRLMTASLAVYLRVGYGSAYGDEESDRDTINTALLQIEELVIAAKEAAARGRLAPGERMLVVFDVLEDSFWRPGASHPPVPSGFPLDEAQNWLLADG